eukprot:CAMPEP_0206244078 /NCGR_PEP_ID=MMETSP0047_2-20121206/17958_1 /ASSEMBLY_ACC=CAM_ASM_000192 /TAXON_ID=195065 /ORGANISM="Chroomonas mesostigmatica_cf, Strain CCMP1168" /LENGTH=102 /DNA_ID=CAMNT_0053669259 /DNA_START=234 /DNA_END=539 /DNA_ORIENTATION=-
MGLIWKDLCDVRYRPASLLTTKHSCPVSGTRRRLTLHMRRRGVSTKLTHTALCGSPQIRSHTSASALPATPTPSTKRTLSPTSICPLSALGLPATILLTTTA